jgi:hypothetical protein
VRSLAPRALALLVAASGLVVMTTGAAAGAAYLCSIHPAIKATLQVK